MKSGFYILIAMAMLASCGGKPSMVDTKKSKKPVISAFESTNEQQESQVATAVLDSPKFIPQEEKPEVSQTTVDKNSPKEVIKGYTDELQKIQEDTTTKGEKEKRKYQPRLENFLILKGFLRRVWDRTGISLHLKNNKSLFHCLQD